jgi:hypothetical protein
MARRATAPAIKASGARIRWRRGGAGWGRSSAASSLVQRSASAGLVEVQDLDRDRST